MLGRHSFSGGGSRPLDLRSLGEGGSRPTRRSFIRAGAGLAAIIASGRAPAALIRSMIAARNGLMAGGLSAKSYVQDGLIAMWDGIENAEWGVHDAEATVWKDLVGSNDATLTSTAYFDANSIRRDTQGNGAMALSASALSGINAVEVCFDHAAASVEVLFCAGTSPSLLVSYIDYQGNSRFQYGNNRLMYANAIGDAKCTLCGFFDSNIALNGSVLTTVGITDSWGSLYNVCAIGGRNGSYSAVGHIYSVRAYSRALTAAEIAANYAVDKARFNLPEP